MHASKKVGWWKATVITAVTGIGFVLVASGTGWAPGHGGVPGGYEFQTVDVPFGMPGEDIAIGLTWINNRGVITQQYQSPPSPNWWEYMHTAVLCGDTWTIIDVPGAVTTGGTNANNHGQVALTYTYEDGIWHVAIYDEGELTPFPDLPEYPTAIFAQAINELGQVAAVVIDEEYIYHGLVGDPSDYEVFDYPGDDVVYTLPFGINNARVVVGQHGLSDGTNHGFLYDGEDFVTLDVPGALVTAATSINNRGNVVGIQVNADLESLGWVLRRGQFTDFRVPGATITWPYYINDRGQIAGVYMGEDGVFHGFVATPAPIH
jgi:hypothetical protein